ncbi:hypothetical protein OG905_22800 [Streptomyces sp. NBC_00322]|uniref:hypothetical protein n=1 Tax=Streptomyces sp. NBC_00322 TaxID=2975712 RepID=UPI002E2CA8BF|nr:hypothetical protein [Streptomyces sp. NBC_00322]
MDGASCLPGSDGILRTTGRFGDPKVYFSTGGPESAGGRVEMVVYRGDVDGG